MIRMLWNVGSNLDIHNVLLHLPAYCSVWADPSSRETYQSWKCLKILDLKLRGKTRQVVMKWWWWWWWWCCCWWWRRRQYVWESSFCRPAVVLNDLWKDLNPWTTRYWSSFSSGKGEHSLVKHSWGYDTVSICDYRARWWTTTRRGHGRTPFMAQIRHNPRTSPKNIT